MDGDHHPRHSVLTVGQTLYFVCIFVLKSDPRDIAVLVLLAGGQESQRSYEACYKW